MTELPYDLGNFISKKQRLATEGNQSDNKPTYQSEMDEIAKDCQELYERGLALIASISQEDLERCRKLCAHRQGNTYGLNDLQQARVKEERVLVPKYVVYIEEVLKLQDILK